MDAEVSFDGKVKDIGAVRNSGDEFRKNAANELQGFLHGSDYVAGHNLISHDLKYLQEILDKAGVKKYIDTLYLSPLLFPKKPYHKLLKDDKFSVDELNNPLNDAKKAMGLFFDEVAAFEKLDKGLQGIYYALLKDQLGFGHFFEYLGFSTKNYDVAGFIKEKFKHKLCTSAPIELVVEKYPIELAYATAQIDIMEQDSASITPPWVLKSYPKVENVLQLLKGTSCGDCKYCLSNLDVVAGLNKWFGYPSFRTYNGEALQEMAAQTAIEGKSLLAIFPTGGGKSITFQLPALMQGENEKGLTVVVSPLQSLQKDQVDNLETEHSITKAVRLDGSLDPIERQKYIERVESGGASLLYISPESLRSKSIERLLIKRNVVRFVIDEAHCFSAWGQDFRTDYLYIAEFIKNLQKTKGNNKVIPVSCFTATAKQEVVADIIKYFSDNLGLELKKVVSTAGRKNLAYHAIHAADEDDKKQKLRDLLEEFKCPTIIYVSRTHRASALAKELTEIGFQAIAYHGKMDKKDRIANQDAFIKGECNIIVATKAFGMGVDKKDVRLVIHFDISTSLEDYVQEAGRAGRDEKLEAACYALFNDDDINKHFAFLSQTKITKDEIGQIWRAIKRLTAKRDNITASALDIAREAGWSDEKEDEIKTRVATSINALEQVHFLKRGQNMPKVYANSILAKSMIEASEKIEQATNFDSDKQKEDARRVLARLFKTRAKGGRDADDNNEHIDYIADREQLDVESVMRIVEKLKEIKILDDIKDLYAFLQKDNGNHAKHILRIHQNIEQFLHEFLLQHETELRAESKFNLKDINAALQEKHPDSSIAALNRILNFYDINQKRLVKRTKTEHKDYVSLKPCLPIDEIKKICEKRIRIASYIIKQLYNKLASLKKEEGDTKIEFSVLELMHGFIADNLMFREETTAEEIEDALYYLKRIKSLEIDGGFLVIYNRMSIQRLEKDGSRKYTKELYQDLSNYYESKKDQIHVIGEYLKLLSQDYEKALEFTHDYFAMDHGMFKHKYFYGRYDELKLNMTKGKYNQLFSGLSDTQREIINNSKDRYIAVIAGPGSGKTMLLTHKLASIYMQEDIKHEQILMLTFSRAAATEFKSRLIKLIGGAANFIKVKTFHSYCFDLLGRVGNLEKSKEVIAEAVKKIEAHEVDNSKLTNAIMVIDEAQDMSETDYALIVALMRHNDGMKVIAVGDDDQTIYEWDGRSSKFLGQLTKTQDAAKYELVENFRSAKNLIEFSNNFAVKISNRLKTKPLKAVKTENGNLSIGKLSSENIEQPIVNLLLQDKPSGSTCIIVKSNEQASNIVGLLNQEGISAKIIQSNSDFNLADLCEVRFFLDLVDKGTSATIDADSWDEAKIALRREYIKSANYDNVLKLIRDFESINTRHKYKVDLRHFVRESKLEDFITQDNTILVSTIHQTKGREFDNVYLALSRYGKLIDADYRQIYVAITRAKSNLHIQYNGNYFDNINAFGVRSYSDNTQYAKPNKITVPLGFRDIFLDYTTNQALIKSLRSGYALKVTEKGCFADGKQVVAFSKACQDKIADYQSRGFVLSRAIINHIVFWVSKDFPKEEQKEKERLIILPNLEFIRKD